MVFKDSNPIQYTIYMNNTSTFQIDEKYINEGRRVILVFKVTNETSQPHSIITRYTQNSHRKPIHKSSHKTIQLLKNANENALKIIKLWLLYIGMWTMAYEMIKTARSNIWQIKLGFLIQYRYPKS